MQYSVDTRAVKLKNADGEYLESVLRAGDTFYDWLQRRVDSFKVNALINHVVCIVIFTFLFFTPDNL